MILDIGGLDSDINNMDHQQLLDKIRQVKKKYNHDIENNPFLQKLASASGDSNNRT